jgi:hypothetical protein
MMDAGQDERLTAIHARAMDRINEVMIDLQDDTICRLEDYNAELRSKLRDAERERDEYKVRLEACGNFNLNDTPEEIAEVILAWQTEVQDRARPVVNQNVGIRYPLDMHE